MQQAKRHEYWICSLSPENIEDWAQGLLDEKARLLNISGWIIPLPIDREGNIMESSWNEQDNNLPAAPWIHLKYPIGPSEEIKLASHLNEWWKAKQTLRLMDQKLLVISGSNNLSHKKFSFKRLKLALPDTLIAGQENEYGLKLNQENIDLLIQSNSEGSEEKPINYLKNLKRAHHDMNLEQLLIPSVKGVQREKQGLWSNASASHYQQWVLQASAWSRLRFLEEDQAPLLIDNWESHQRWWHPNIKHKINHYALPKLSDAQPSVDQWGQRKRENIALMIHGYYLDKLKIILDQLPPGGNQDGLPGIDLYVSTPLNQISDAKELVLQHRWPRVYLCGVENRGRDIGPFLLNLLPEALQINHISFVKIHTKKSPQLKLGDAWCEHLTTSLLQKKFLVHLNESILNDHNLGLFAPSGSLIKSTIALGLNVDHLQKLLRRTRWSGSWALSQSYVAGSMMAGRLSTLQSLEELQLTINDFEVENGQTDGTLAHALERIISWQYLSKGLMIKTLTGNSPPVPKFGYGWV